ncbi:hypothetical protein [Methylobacterium sp. Leaf117]|uniref:hypothetical protein n=1 Tax=Methylobacterium sp. Leaf117 TaxID=1736260 RepID=UPI000AC558F0|nr:hypothetical protein [Methylobacterium sp. Leaf117]
MPSCFFRRPFRLILAVTALGVMPAAASEAGRGPASGNPDPWRLRTRDVAVATLDGRAGKTRPASAIPEARRVVRVVYPGLTEPR